ncbi:MAG: recombinase family protein [Clostridium tyrobutyricum]|jgi:DNA invertase Pin-like site-specific DNA recombinase|uniref:recombinase family protein n=1 Tax=Clostridium tyrobutyricum TaxID=1519 RepID=UPI00073D2C30|nr:recombinase family protein [Clostridium tyrobutyricum]MCH4198708.1 recombinase family protein [Clostridium tyrobutyricum]MCH4238075.1 recombinase family protein [Clostridium tyrobutyricum]MCH4257445.1 recombinase family protein [Clostridium tyrobutyricum]MCI1238285.1 recombinase family protein [Clostridium tyrobutyricum]MCI1651998.1 recombinase family protein [Clostridium tyrobutyricum]
MNIGYIRVSTVEQNEGRQYESMKNLGIEKFFEEKISAKDINRPKLNEMLEFARSGDTIYVKDFSRLARSTKDLLNIIDLVNNKGIKLISLKENLDTTTSTGKLMVTMIGAIYQFERENTLERQREGIAIAKKEGKYKGRKEIDYPENWTEVYNKYKCRELKGTEAMQELGLKKTTFYKLVKKYEGK